MTSWRFKTIFPSNPLASFSFSFYCLDMKEPADREKTEQALGKVLLTRFYSQQVHLDVGCNL